jgi:hypothetical protein
VSESSSVIGAVKIAQGKQAAAGQKALDDLSVQGPTLVICPSGTKNYGKTRAQVRRQQQRAESEASIAQLASSMQS